MDVLAADGYVGSLSSGDHRGQQDGRWEKGDLIAGVAGDKGQKCVDKGLGFSRRLVHLPIGSNQFLA